MLGVCSVVIVVLIVVCGGCVGGVFVLFSGCVWLVFVMFVRVWLFGFAFELVV